MHRKSINKAMSTLLAAAMTCSALMVPQTVLADEEADADEIAAEATEATEAAEDTEATGVTDATEEEEISVNLVSDDELPEDGTIVFGETEVPDEEADATEALDTTPDTTDATEGETEVPVNAPETYDSLPAIQVTLGKVVNIEFSADSDPMFELTVPQTGFYIIETVDVNLAGTAKEEVDYMVEPVSYEPHFEESDFHYYYLEKDSTFSFVPWTPYMSGAFCVDYAGDCCYAKFDEDVVEVIVSPDENFYLAVNAIGPSGYETSYKWEILSDMGYYELSEYGVSDTESELYVESATQLFDYDPETGNFYYMSPEGERDGIVYYNDRYGGPTAEIMCTMFFERNGDDPVVLQGTEFIVLRASDFDKSVSARGLASTYNINDRHSQPEAWSGEDQMTIPVTIETTYDDVDTSVYYDWYVYSYSGLSELEDGVITVSNTTREGDTDRVEFCFDLEKLPLGRFTRYCCKVTFEGPGETATRMIDVEFNTTTYTPYINCDDLKYLDFYVGDKDAINYNYYEGIAGRTYNMVIDYTDIDMYGWDTDLKIYFIDEGEWRELPETSGSTTNYVDENGKLTIYVNDGFPVTYDDTIPGIAGEYAVFKCVATATDALGNEFGSKVSPTVFVRFADAPSAYADLPVEHDHDLQSDLYCTAATPGSQVTLETLLLNYQDMQGNITCEWSYMNNTGIFEDLGTQTMTIGGDTESDRFTFTFDTAQYDPTVLYEYGHGRYLVQCMVRFPDGSTANLLFRIDVDGVPNACVLTRSLALEGYIGLNFYLDLPDEFVNDEGAYILVDGIRKDIPPKDIVRDRYCVTAELPAAMMRHNVVLKLITGDGEMYPLLDTDRNYCPDGYVFSVQDYIDIAKARLDPQKDAALLNMIKYMSEYGMYAQRYFNIDKDKVKTDTSIFSEITALGPDDLSAYAPVINLDGGSGIAFANSTLDLDSATTLSHYFTLDAGKSIEDYVFLVDGTEVTLDSTGKYTLTYVPAKDKYCLAIHNIAAAELDQDYDVEVFDADSEMVVDLQYSALSYVYRALVSYKNMDTTTITEQQAYLFYTVRALYLYYLAAEAYFG